MKRLNYAEQRSDSTVAKNMFRIKFTSKHQMSETRGEIRKF